MRFGIAKILLYLSIILTFISGNIFAQIYPIIIPNVNNFAIAGVFLGISLIFVTLFILRINLFRSF